MYNLRHPKCVLSRPTHTDQRLLSRTSTSRGRVSKCQSSGVPHLVTCKTLAMGRKEKSLCVASDLSYL